MIHAIACGYRCESTYQKCLDSIAMQVPGDYESKTTVKVDVDGTNRQYLVKTTIDAIQEANPEPEDIMALIDLDDFSIDEYAFRIIADYYAKSPTLLLTHGSYVNLSTNAPGKFNGAYEPTESFRTSPWRLSHLKTFKYKLWMKLPDEELRDRDGNYFRCASDRAMMIPLAEMAGHDRIAHIPMLLYGYNDLNPQSAWKTMKEESIRNREYIMSKKPLSRIDSI